MTQLISKIGRDSLGIDTLPRAIIYACLSLEIATDGNTDLADKVLITTADSSGTDTVNTNFIASVELPLKRVDALKDGLNLIENINTLTSAIAPEFITSSLTNPIPTNPLPTEPTEVDTLEKYLYWCCSILAASVAPDLSYVSRSFNEERDGIILSINLPINYQKTLLGENLLEASINFVTNYVTDLTQINDDWTIPPSAQYWGDPVADIATLKGLTKNVGTTLWLTEKNALYTLISALPENTEANDDLYIEPTTQTASEVWKKGGTGQGTAAQTPEQIRDALASLTDTNRLDATAIKNLPTSGDPGQSAYEIAVANGFNGTEAQWLNSLKGSNAYEIAVTNGFNGTEAQWLNSLKGERGLQGLSNVKTKSVENLSSDRTLTLTEPNYLFFNPAIPTVDVIVPALTSNDYFDVTIFNLHETNAIALKDDTNTTFKTLSSAATEKDRVINLFWDGTKLHALPLGGY